MYESETHTREAPLLSNRLVELADRAGASWRRSVEEWHSAAVLLAEARELAAHGEWGRFLETAGIPERTARNMLRLAPFKSETVSDLGGVRATLDVLSMAGGVEGLKVVQDVATACNQPDTLDDALRSYAEAFHELTREFWETVQESAPSCQAWWHKHKPDTLADACALHRRVDRVLASLGGPSLSHAMEQGFPEWNVIEGVSP